MSFGLLDLPVCGEHQLLVDSPLRGYLLEHTSGACGMGVAEVPSRQSHETAFVAFNIR